MALRFAVVAFAGFLISVPQIAMSDTLKPGIFPSNSPDFDYQGTWTANGALFKDGPASVSSSAGAKVSFDFEGNQVRILRAYDPDQGKVRICVDSDCYAVSNKSFYRLAAPQPWAKTFSTVGKHHVSIEVDTGSFALAGVEVFSNDPVFSPGKFDDTDDRLSLDGSWFLQRREGPWKSTVHSSVDPNATAGIRFRGTGLVVGAVLFDDRGEVQLCIDGTCHQRKVFSPGLRWQEPIFVAGMQPGLHVATLRKTSGKLFDIDYVEVINEEPLAAGRYSAAEPGAHHIGDWSQESPQRSHSVSANAAVYVPFRGRGIRWSVYRNEFGGKVEACMNSSCRELDTFSAEPETETIDFDAGGTEFNSLLVRKLTGRALYSAGFEVY